MALKNVSVSDFEPHYSLLGYGIWKFIHSEKIRFNIIKDWYRSEDLLKLLVDEN